MMDEQKSAQDERRQDTTVVAWYQTTTRQATVTDLQLLSARASFSTTVSDLGVHIDGQLSVSTDVVRNLLMETNQGVWGGSPQRSPGAEYGSHIENTNGAVTKIDLR